MVVLPVQFRTLRLQMERKTEILPHFNLTLSKTQMKFCLLTWLAKKTGKLFWGSVWHHMPLCNLKGAKQTLKADKYAFEFLHLSFAKAWAQMQNFIPFNQVKLKIFFLHILQGSKQAYLGYKMYVAMSNIFQKYLK